MLPRQEDISAVKIFFDSVENKINANSYKILTMDNLVMVEFQKGRRYHVIRCLVGNQSIVWGYYTRLSDMYKVYPTETINISSTTTSLEDALMSQLEKDLGYNLVNIPNLEETLSSMAEDIIKETTSESESQSRLNKVRSIFDAVAGKIARNLRCNGIDSFNVPIVVFTSEFKGEEKVYIHYFESVDDSPDEWDVCVEIGKNYTIFLSTGSKVLDDDDEDLNELEKILIKEFITRKSVYKERIIYNYKHSRCVY